MYTQFELREAQEHYKEQGFAADLEISEFEKYEDYGVKPPRYTKTIYFTPQDLRGFSYQIDRILHGFEIREEILKDLIERIREK